MRSLLLAALIAAAVPADAGVKASYDGASEPRRLEIEVADNGDYRAGPPGDAQYLVSLGGVRYLVSTTPEGPEVVRVTDMATALDGIMPPLFGQLFGAMAAASPPRPAKFEAAGSREVAGFKGQVYRVTMGEPPETTDYVVSADPLLKPVGTALGGFLETLVLVAAPMIGPMAGDIVKDMRSVFALGTPIEGGSRFKLVSAGAADVAPQRLTLPATPLTLEELRKRLKPQPAPEPMEPGSVQQSQ